MYLEHEYVGTLEDLKTILNQTIRGFAKVRSHIPIEIGEYFPNTSDYKEVIDNINEAITNCADLIKRLDDPKINKDHLATGLRYIHGTLLKEY